MRCFPSRVLVILVLVCAWTLPASAQLNYLGFPPQAEIGSYRDQDFREVSPARFNRVNDTLSITGDVEFRPGAEAFGDYSVSAIQLFSGQSLLPTELTATLSADYKLVNTGGRTTDENRSSRATPFLVLAEVPFDDRDALGFPSNNIALQAFGRGDVAFLNGFTVISETVEAKYVLSPGVAYAAVFGVQFFIDNIAAMPQDAEARTFWEAGGISDFDGLRLTMNSRVVPEPAAAGLLLFGGMALLSRRRTR